MTMHQAKICVGCWQQLRLPVPLRGALSVPFRAFGIRPSRMNPNTCIICELMFTTVMRTRKVTADATVLFADLRGYTTLSQSLSPDAVARSPDQFDERAGASVPAQGISVTDRALCGLSEACHRWNECRQSQGIQT
jgi:adenylate cyclase